MHPSSYDPGSRSAPKRRKRRVGLSAYQEERLKSKLRKSSPSEPWVEAQVKSVFDQDEAGEVIVYRYHDLHAFPPGETQTAMIRCPACGIFMPPNAFENGKCLDHARHQGWGPSPSAIAIQALQKYNLRLDDLQLPSEDATSLNDEIEQYNEKTARKSKSGF